MLHFQTKYLRLKLQESTDSHKCILVQEKYYVIITKFPHMY